MVNLSLLTTRGWPHCTIIDFTGQCRHTLHLLWHMLWKCIALYIYWKHSKNYKKWKKSDIYYFGFLFYTHIFFLQKKTFFECKKKKTFKLLGVWLKWKQNQIKFAHKLFIFNIVPFLAYRWLSMCVILISNCPTAQNSFTVYCTLQPMNHN